ncbi:MAG: hypothetical protein ABJA34_11670 [Pseudonocardiales bacterium]
MALEQRRAGQSLAILLAGLFALAAFSLLTARPGDAAATWVVTFTATGASPGVVTAARGDTVVFKNNLPLTPATGLSVPVGVDFAGQSFNVGGTPVARTVEHSSTFSGTYSVLGLIHSTTSSGTVNVANAAPAPPPSPPGGGTGPGGRATPPAHGRGKPGGTTAHANLLVTARRPHTPAGDRDTVPDSGTAVNRLLAQPGAAGAAATAPGRSVTIAPQKSQADNATAAGNPLISTSSTPSSVFGLAALTGVVLLLGVGTALTRELLTARTSATIRGA